MRGTDASGDRRTPDLDDCRPSCRNLARTDRDMVTVHRQAAQLRVLADDPLRPPIRHARERRQLERLEKTITDHAPDQNQRESEQP